MLRLSLTAQQPPLYIGNWYQVYDYVIVVRGTCMDVGHWVWVDCAVLQYKFLRIMMTAAIAQVSSCATACRGSADSAEHETGSLRWVSCLTPEREYLITAYPTPPPHPA